MFAVEPAAMLALMIPIISIILGIGCGMFALYLNYQKRKSMFTLYHQERMAALEKGVDLPPLPDALFSEEDRPANPRRHLLKGLAWLFTGLGLGIALFFTVAGDWALFCLVPVGLGTAHLIYYFVEGRRELEATPPGSGQPASMART